MSDSHATLKLFRKLHLYIGVFISPALLFFAVTGALQTFSLHEQVRGSDYKPSLFLQTIAQIHKNATWMVQQKKPGPDAGRPGPDAGRPGPDAPKADRPGEGAADGSVSKAPALTKRQQHLPLKIFFLLVAVGLFVSTGTGIYMSYKYMRNRWLITALLVAGAVIPLVLLPF